VKCALCGKKECYTGKDCTKISDNKKLDYNGDDLKSMRYSTEIEAKHYMKKTRLEELIDYAKMMEYKHLGIAFCIGFEAESRTLTKILERDFEISSVCCKVCGIDKSEFNLERLHGESGTEAMCNPIGQAEILNTSGTDMNIMLGLCIGHDILFTKYSEAPVTTFAVKDRVLSHNPLGAIYSNYYLIEKFGLKDE
jgi:uncharacterized metal-binding protein